VAVDAALRERMGAAALAVARAVGYTNAGTVEMMLTPDGAFYFLEVNTRLQVEHPVTECVTGLDIVREQIRVARGEPLGFGQADVRLDGAAVEVRLYAEDADRGFLPTSGRVVGWRAPAGDGVRVDTGIAGPTEVGVHYDPMLAKIIARAPTRAEAIRRLARALRELHVPGITTNRAFLVALLEHPAFQAGAIDTHFLDRHGAELRAAAAVPADVVREAAIAACLADHERRRAARTVLPAQEPGFRNNPVALEWAAYRAGETAIRVEYRNLGGGRFRCVVDGVAGTVRASVDAGAIAIEDDAGLRRQWRVAFDGDRHYVGGPAGQVALIEEPRFPDVAAAVVAGGLVAPMPGAVVRVLVSEGQEVSAGDTLVILEAMKMEHRVTAAQAGVVRELLVAEGDQVDTHQLLVVLAA
jgi:acetyl/propionyl-CoA carboxylase alpha subunit